MFEWLTHLRRRSPEEREPEVEAGQREQQRQFDAWSAALREVDRVQRLAEQRHSAIRRPRRPRRR